MTQDYTDTPFPHYQTDLSPTLEFFQQLQQYNSYFLFIDIAHEMERLDDPDSPFVQFFDKVNKLHLLKVEYNFLFNYRNELQRAYAGTSILLHQCFHSNPGPCTTSDELATLLNLLHHKNPQFRQMHVPRELFMYEYGLSTFNYYAQQLYHRFDYDTEFDAVKEQQMAIDGKSDIINRVFTHPPFYPGLESFPWGFAVPNTHTKG